MSARKILWHDSYASNIKVVMTDKEWPKYIKSIINYATANSYDAVSLSAIGASVVQDTTLQPSELGFLPDSKTAYKYINQFIVEAEKAGLQVGLNVYQKIAIPSDKSRTDTIDQLVGEIAANIVHTKPLIIGIDGEDNKLKENTARTPTEFATQWMNSLDKNGVNYDTFAILGGNKQESRWSQHPKFENVFEYYSEDGWSGDFNHHIGVKLKNNPQGALSYIQSQMASGAVQNPKDPVTGLYSGIVPAFSIGTGDGTNTLGRHANGKPIGPAVFGTWKSEEFNNFIDLFESAYPSIENIFVYHGDQLPLAWIPSSESASPEAFYSELFAMM
jgi:hypothetical protein